MALLVVTARVSARDEMRVNLGSIKCDSTVDVKFLVKGEFSIPVDSDTDDPNIEIRGFTIKDDGVIVDARLKTEPSCGPQQWCADIDQYAIVIYANITSDQHYNQHVKYCGPRGGYRARKTENLAAKAKADEFD